MRPVPQRLSAAGFSPWIPLNRLAHEFSVGLGVVISSSASLTYSVQFTMDNVYDRVQEFSIARTTTTGTITLTNHGLSVDDWVFLSGNIPAPFISTHGFAVASVVDANSFTITVANSGATAVASGSGAWLHKARVQPHDTMAAETTSTSGNYAFPPFATRFAITTYASGFADFTVISTG